MKQCISFLSQMYLRGDPQQFGALEVGGGGGRGPQRGLELVFPWLTPTPPLVLAPVWAPPGGEMDE